MKKYKKYEEIKKNTQGNKDRPFNELFDEGFYESLDLVGEIVIRSYKSPFINPKSSSISQSSILQSMGR
jgi:hypothetical protein